MCTQSSKAVIDVETRRYQASRSGHGQLILQDIRYDSSDDDEGSPACPLGYCSEDQIDFPKVHLTCFGSLGFVPQLRLKSFLSFHHLSLPFTAMHQLVG